MYKRQVFGLLCTNLFFRLFSPSESIFNYGVEYLWVVTVFSAGMFVEISVDVYKRQRPMGTSRSCTPCCSAY